MLTVGASLPLLPSLRTIDMSWVHMRLFGDGKGGEPQSAPAQYRMPGWLRSLKRVRRVKSEVCIRMLLRGLVSVEVLEQDQGVVDEEGNRLMVLGVDAEETVGFCEELEALRLA